MTLHNRNIKSSDNSFSIEDHNYAYIAPRLPERRSINGKSGLSTTIKNENAADVASPGQIKSTDIGYSKIDYNMVTDLTSDQNSTDIGYSQIDYSMVKVKKEMSESVYEPIKAPNTGLNATEAQLGPPPSLSENKEKWNKKKDKVVCETSNGEVSVLHSTMDDNKIISNPGFQDTSHNTDRDIHTYEQPGVVKKLDIEKQTFLPTLISNPMYSSTSIKEEIKKTNTPEYCIPSDVKLPNVSTSLPHEAILDSHQKDSVDPNHR